MFNYIQLINVNAHIGSSKQCWMTLTSRFIFGFRKGITLINIGYTSFHLRRSILFVKKLVSKGGTIIINSLYCKTHIGLINRFYNIGQIVAPDDWIGGYLSNFRNLKKKIISKKKFRSFASVLINLNYNIDNRFISSEARNINLPIVSIFDTNSKSSLFDFPIPTNNKNSSVRTFYAFLFSSAVFYGLISKIIKCKDRCTKAYIFRSQFIRKINIKYSNPNIYNNFSYISRYKNIYISRYKNIYVNIFISRNVNSLYFNFIKIYKNFLNKIFVDFKYKLASRENILSNLDWIDIFFSNVKSENIFFKVKNIFFASTFKNIFNSKFRIIRKLKKVWKIYSKISRSRSYKFAAIKYVKTFNKRVLKLNYPYLGSFPTYNNGIYNFSRTYGVNKSLMSEQNRFKIRFPFRYYFGFGIRISIIKRFLKIIRLHRRVNIKRIFFKIIIKSRNIKRIKRSFKKKTKLFFRVKKITTKKYIFNNFVSRIKFSKSKHIKKIGSKIKKKFIFTKKISNFNKNKKNVGRWNRTAAISFSGLYSTIELSRFL